MMQTFSLSILAPERRLTQDEAVSSVILTSAEGEIEILPGHADMVSKLETGRFTYKPVQGAPIVGVISSGFVNVEAGAVKVLAETIELATEIDLSRAKRAQAQAEKMLTDASLDEHAFKKYQLKLQRSIIRQNVGGSSH
jgi:F-type H+-transporting ATPase subunit epsilon